MPSFVPSTPRTFLATPPCLVMSAQSSQLDLDVDTSRHVKPHQGVNRLRCRVDDVDQPLVRSHLEVLTRVLVLVRRPNHAVNVLLRRQRHRPHDLRTGPHDGVDNLPRRAINDLMVIALQPNADLLSRHRSLVSLRLGPLLSSRGRNFPKAGTSRPAKCRGDRVPPALSGYFWILMTRPAPTVRPPSRIAKRRPSSMAIGWIRSTFISVLSPGSTISVPSGRCTTPVTSVVRK